MSDEQQAVNARAKTIRDTDADWEEFAQREPYWAVLTADQFRRANLDQAARIEFFANGEGTVAHYLGVLRDHFGAPEQLDVSLDFGCGVGRLLFPLACRSNLAIGVDVSLTMLDECRKNAALCGIRNVELRQADDTLSRLGEYSGKVSLISSL